MSEQDEPAQGGGRVLNRTASSVASSDDSARDTALHDDLGGLKRPGDQDGEDDEEDDEQHAHFILGVWGVIYTVSREKKANYAFVAFKLLMDALQILLLTINASYGYHIQADSTWWFVINFPQLNSFMTARGFTFFLACLYVLILLLAVTVVLCFWVAWSFQNSRFDYVWPIGFLKVFANVFFQILDIASMTLFLMALDCQYNAMGSPDTMYYNQEFPEQMCWRMPYLIHAVVAALSVIVFVVMAAVFQMGDMETNMLSPNPMAMAHSKVEVLGFLLKFVMTSSSVFINRLDWLSVSYVLCSSCLVYLYVRWVPHYMAWMNYVRCGTYTAVLYSAVVLAAMSLAPVARNGTSDEIYAYTGTCTVALVAGLAPAFGLGALMAYCRLRYFRVTVVNRWRGVDLSQDPELVHKFGDPREVEIAARCCRKWINVKTVDPEAVKLAYVIIKSATKMMPNVAYVHILLSSFNVDVQHSLQTGHWRLQTAKKCDPSFLDKFAIFSREQQQTQYAAGADNGNGADLLSYVQMQRNLRLATKVYKACLVAIQEFWRALQAKEVKFEVLCKCVAKIDANITHADKVYRDMIQENLDNWRLIRVFARFLEHIKNSPWESAKWHAEADRLFAAAEEAHTNAFATVNASDMDPETAATVKESLDDVKPTIIIDSHGIIVMANKAALDTFGYKRVDLVGGNVNVLMPSPFKEHHDGYLKHYNDTGNAVILGIKSEVLSQHAKGHVFATSLLVTRISGMMLDSMFMGVLEVIPADTRKAHLWVMPDSTIIATDVMFFDWFGLPCDSVKGQPFTTHLAQSDAAEMQRLFQVVKEYDHRHIVAAEAAKSRARRALLQMPSREASVAKAPEPETSLGAPAPSVHRMEEVHVAHAFSSSVVCNLEIRNAGSGRWRFFVVEVMRHVSDAGDTLMLVADTAGRVRHVTQDLAKALGITVEELLTTGAGPEDAGGAVPLTAAGALTSRALAGGGGSAAPVFALDAILPEPFSQMHVSLLNRPLSGSKPPPSSCRTGLSVCLTDRSDKSAPPKLVPYHLRVVSKLVPVKGRPKDAPVGGDAMETLHVVSLTPRTIEEALDQRRLSVVVDLEGTVRSVGASGHALFGFDPQTLVGLPCSAFIDVMAEAQAEGRDNVSSLLKHLATRSVMTPGCSFRVGVTPPPKDAAAVAKFGSLMEKHVSAKSKIPAVLQASVIWLGSKAAGSSGAPAAAQQGHMATAPLVTASRTPSPSPSRACITREEEDELMTLLPGADAGAVEADPLVELLLWRTDCLTAVMELDSRGTVRDTSMSPLYNPGLVFGTDPLQKHINALLPLGNLPVSSLFEPALGGAAGGLGKPSLRGGLKAGTNVSARKACGAVNRFICKHLDGGDMALDVQAVSMKGSRNHIWLVLHPAQPSLGRPKFREWLAQDNLRLQQMESESSGDWRSDGKPLPLPSPRPGALQRGLGSRSTRGPATASPAAAAASLKRHVSLGGVTSLGGGTPPLSAGRPPRRPEGSPLAEAVLESALESALPAGLADPDLYPDRQLGYGVVGLPPPKRATLRKRKKKKQAAGGDAGGEDEAAGAAAAAEAALAVDALVAEALQPALEEITERAAANRDGKPDTVPGAEAGAPLAGEAPRPVVKGASVHPAKGRAGLYEDEDKGHVGGRASSPAGVVDSAVRASPEGVHAASEDEDEVGLAEPSKLAEIALWAKAAALAPSPPASLSAAGMGSEGQESEEPAGQSEAGVRAWPTDGDASMLPLQERTRQVTEHARAHASHAGGSSDDANPPPPQGNDSAGFSGDFRRGKRFKRLLRLLGGAEGQRAINTFQRNTLLVVALVTCVTVTCFVCSDLLINQQSAKVGTIMNAGFAANAVGKIAITTNNLIILFGNNTQPGLEGLESFDTDTPLQLNMLYSQAQEFLHLLSLTYSNINSLPSTGGATFDALSRIWGQKSLNISNQLNSQPGTSVEYLQIDLWEAGNLIVNKALNVYQNAQNLQALDLNNTPFNLWSDVVFILNNTQDTIIPAFTDTMDNLLQVVLSDAATVNRVHMVFLVIEGIICSVVAVCAMYIFATQAVIHRWNKYHIFMVVPSSIMRALAAGIAKALAGAAAGEEALDAMGADQDEGFHESGGAIHLTFHGKEPLQDASALAVLRACVSWMTSWNFRRTRVSPYGRQQQAATYRKLVRSFATVFWFTLPFVVYGVVMLVINSLAHQQLAVVTNPTALFNLVNYVIVSYYRFYVAFQTTVIESDPALKPALRAYLGSHYSTMVSDYTAMLYGSGAANDTSPHVALVTSGLMQSSVGSSVLFQTTACLRQDQSTCLPPSDPLYQFMHHGLDAILSRYFEGMRTAISDTGIYPSFQSQEFVFAVESHPDIEGGLLQLCNSNFAYVTQQYSLVMQTHVVGLVMTLLLMASVMLLLLRPFVRETRAENKRLAELLSQLPQEVNIEAFVKRTLLEDAFGGGGEGEGARGGSDSQRGGRSMRSYVKSHSMGNASVTAKGLGPTAKISFQAPGDNNAV